jgi:mRNA interferase MazF
MAKRIGAAPPEGKRGSAVYVPDVGDLVWFSFSPQTGREQAGRRPALVLSARSYNGKTGLCLVCPVTGQAKGYPFEVELGEGLPVQGVVLSDHVKNTDWQARKAERITSVEEEVLARVRAKLKLLLGI